MPCRLTASATCDIRSISAIVTWTPTIWPPATATRAMHVCTFGKISSSSTAMFRIDPINS
ncbi:hypothetical protein WME91_39040 [Sorangium sp. So ce269]